MRGCVVRLRALCGATCRRLSSTQAHPKDDAKHLVSSAYGHMDMPSMTVTEYVWKDMDKWPDHTAIVCGATSKGYTYSALRKLSKQFGAGLLAGAKLRPGSVISVILPNCPEYPAIMLGSLEAGLILSPINPLYGPNELKHHITDSGAEVVITFPGKLDDVKEACKGLNTLIILVGGGGDGGVKMEDVTAKGAEMKLPPLPKPSSLAILPYSSGTTGLPKGVKLTHDNIVSNLVQISHQKIKFLEDTTKTHQEVSPCVLPFFHIYGLCVGLLSYLSGGRQVVSMPKFDPQLFINTIKNYKGSIVHVVPPLVQFLAQHPIATKESIDSVRALINGAAPMSPTDAEVLMKKGNFILVSGYGLTESSPAIACCMNSESDLHSVGFVVSNSILKIANVDTGDSQDPSVVGEVCCKGPQIMEGYLNNEEATNSTIKNGWLHTGDMGYINKDNGKLYLVDRLKELIKVKGFQVAPLELEELMKSHSQVADVGVVGRPDDRQGEVPVAFIVQRPGADLKPKEIIEYVASRVSAPYKKLADVIIIKEMPRNASGKLLRKKLKEMLR